MLAGGVGYAKKADAAKDRPSKGDDIILMGGDNYRIGMGGGAVSSVATGEYANSIELNAIQRANPEMQKRVYNAIRAVAEKDHNSIISIHDHGAGGHLNCLSELVEEVGGDIDISKLPIGDPTLSDKEIIGNESQERMGLVMKKGDTAELRRIAERERAPFYVIGEVSGKGNFTLRDSKTGNAPIDLELSDMFGSTPKTVMHGSSPKGGADGHGGFAPLRQTPAGMSPEALTEAIRKVLMLESVACKDWLTNKVDRSVTGLIACQQCCGELQLPLNDLGVTAIGYDDPEGIAVSIGHAPAAAMIDPAAGSRLAIAEALTNIIWTPIRDNIYGISLSANWMWPCRNEGEDARLYRAVKGASDFAIALGINIPTGKDSMSMTQKYPDGEKVLSPGTLIISATGQSKDVAATLHPVMSREEDTTLLYIPFVPIEKGDASFPLGGSAYASTIGQVGAKAPDITDPEYFKTCFNRLQDAMFNSMSNPVLAGHDISAGGLITTLLEMCFSNTPQRPGILRHPPLRGAWSRTSGEECRHGRIPPQPRPCQGLDYRPSRTEGTYPESGVRFRQQDIVPGHRRHARKLVPHLMAAGQPPDSQGTCRRALCQLRPSALGICIPQALRRTLHRSRRAPHQGRHHP